jgi:ribonuclease R
MLKAEELLEVIRSKVDHPSTVRELMQLLRLPREQRANLRRRLASLVETGSLIKIRGRRYGIPDLMHLVTGHVQVKPRGLVL